MDLEQALARIAELEADQDVAGSTRAARRIKQLVDQRNEALSKAEDLEAKMTGMQQQLAGFDEVKSARDQAMADMEALRSTHANELTLVGAGLDEEGRTIAQMLYSNLPAEDRPALGEWLANRDALPRALSPYLPAPPEGGAAPVPTPTQPTGAPPLRPNAGVRPSTAAPPTLDAKAISQLSPGEYRRLASEGQIPGRSNYKGG